MNKPELIRWAVNMLKHEFISWRKPPVELPAESVIEDVVTKIIDAARKAQ